MLLLAPKYPEGCRFCRTDDDYDETFLQIKTIKKYATNQNERKRGERSTRLVVNYLSRLPLIHWPPTQPRKFLWYPTRQRAKIPEVLPMDPAVLLMFARCCDRADSIWLTLRVVLFRQMILLMVLSPCTAGLDAANYAGSIVCGLRVLPFPESLILGTSKGSQNSVRWSLFILESRTSRHAKVIPFPC